MTVTELEQIERLDWEQLCEAMQCAYGRPPATHALTASCCATLLCTPSAQHNQKVVSDAIKYHDDQIRCGRCKKTNQASAIRIEPLP